MRNGKEPSALIRPHAVSDGKSQTRSGRTRVRIRWFVLSITALVLVLNYADRSALAVAGPSIIKDFNLSKTEFGLVSSVFFLGYAPFCFVGGYFSDKFGARRVMATAVGWWSLFTALTAAGAGFFSLMVIRFLFGFGEGPQGVLTVKTMRDWFPQRQMGTAVGVTQGATPLGGAIGTPLVAWLIGVGGDWRTPFIVLGVIGFLVTLGWWVIVRDGPERHPWATVEEAGELSDWALAEENGDVAGQETPRLWDLIRRPLVLATSMAFFAYGWVLFTFLSWFPVYLVQVHNLKLSGVAIVGALPWLLGAVGFMSGGFLTDWIAARTGKPAQTRKMIIIAGLTITALLLGGISLISSLTSAVVLMSSIVFTLYLTGTQYFTLIADTTPKAQLGGVMGCVHFLANLSGLFAPVMVGLILDHTKSWALTFGVTGGICLLGAIALTIWGRMPTEGVGL